MTFFSFWLNQHHQNLSDLWSQYPGGKTARLQTFIDCIKANGKNTDLNFEQPKKTSGHQKK